MHLFTKDRFSLQSLGSLQQSGSSSNANTVQKRSVTSSRLEGALQGQRGGGERSSDLHELVHGDQSACARVCIRLKEPACLRGVRVRARRCSNWG